MMIDFDLLTIIIGTLIYAFLCFCIYKKQKREKVYFVFTTIMFCYFMAVIDATLFPVVILDGFSSGFAGRIETIPFANLNALDFYNMLLTVPLGIGMPFIVDKLNTGKGIAAAGLLFGVTVETLQFFEVLLTHGSTIRVLDVNDILFNFFGTLAGFLLLWLFSCGFLRLNEENLNSFWRYVYKVCKKVHIKKS